MIRKPSFMPTLNIRINSTAAHMITGAVLMTAAALAVRAAKSKRLRLPASVSRLTRLYAHPVTVSASNPELAQ